MSALCELDELLFTDSGWFCIDSANARVPHVRPGTLTAALALVGHGAIATVVGRLRPEVVAVDVDAGGAVGDLLVDELADWCATRGLWHLRRASGGGPGRWHLLAVPGVHRGALEQTVATMRRERRLSPTKLDIRAQLRPLSARHRRSSALCDLVGDPQEALDGVRAVLALSSHPPEPERPSTAAPRPVPGPQAPLVPLPRPHRSLPEAWEAYLAGGREALAAAGADVYPATRSHVEQAATFQLVIAGRTEAEAWRCIEASHSTAFIKAKANGRTWWWWQWNTAVTRADDWRRERTAAAPAPTPLAATQAARAAMWAQWTTWGPRSRHSDREVYTAVLERMDRTGATSVQVPQRDLMLDAAIASRTTVRQALVRLQARGLLTVSATYVAGTTDTANTLALPESLTEGRALSLLDPSRCQPPQRRLPLALRRQLGLPVAHAYAALPPVSETGRDLQEVACLAGYATTADEVTPTQERTTTAHLCTLAAYGLATVDELGRWRATTHDLEPGIPTQLRDHAAAASAAVRERVTADRAAFRLAVDPELRRVAWHRQRTAALARQAKLLRARQRAWWDGLDLGDRHRRADALAAAFAASPPYAQTLHKQRLAQQRAAAGECERDRYDAWLSSLSAGELDARSADCALRYASRPMHDRHQLVAAWAEHRTAWALPHHRRASASTTPSKRLPEHDLLVRNAPDADQLDLFIHPALEHRETG